ncbi:uncharacterized protein K452DRAFT_284193 [Aplosporella prunicola CBS 121167]|uniref:Uncharacterized protein n=1 Tax=Aplosporella prunicola CBS 121167 TaxID=1176127 RepID=A0A6A6BNV5_9PEZI|nr:uncharacterized protein K452DRAFT_284193 [Aplosporella prunicola CBS 121167]KAF2145810.1 hypothetical protein K452DRAFT_284193 [Aplosporella prunicola CBS 121167]
MVLFTGILFPCCFSFSASPIAYTPPPTPRKALHVITPAFGLARSMSGQEPDRRTFLLFLLLLIFAFTLYNTITKKRYDLSMTGR